jgi:hypothetical protein
MVIDLEGEGWREGRGGEVVLDYCY